MVRHLLNRAGVPVVMRRYRLPAFDGAEGFLQAVGLKQWQVHEGSLLVEDLGVPLTCKVWAKTYNIKTKKGKAPGPNFANMPGKDMSECVHVCAVPLMKRRGVCRATFPAAACRGSLLQLPATSTTC